MRTNDPNDPIDQLYGEHDHALSQLGILHRTGRAMAQGGVSPELLSTFHGALHFLENEIRAHNQWEEDHLFPLLEKYMGPSGPCSVMRAEHRALWDTYDAMGPVLKKTDDGVADAEAVKHLADLSDAIVDLLSAHIHKENEILFPMARRMLGPGDVERLAAAR